MAQCPHCSSEVPLLGITAKGTSTILKNLLRGDAKLYTCKNCDSNYHISLGSRLLLGVFVFCPVGGIMHFVDEIPACVLDHAVILGIAYALVAGYVWWRCFARLEAEY